MDAHTYAEFLKAQGFNVIETASCYWHDRAMRHHIGPQWVHFFVSGPPHRPVEPSATELMEVLWKGKAIGVKFTAAEDAKGKNSYHFLCSDLAYDFPSLEQKTRNQTRRGLERCCIEQIDFDYLLRNGMSIIRDSEERQGRGVTVSERWWRVFCNSAKRFDDISAWGAFASGELAAFMTTVTIEDVCYIGFLYSLRKHLDAYPNNGLAFVVTRKMLREPGISHISYGTESVEQLNTLEHFKAGMGFSKHPIRQRVIFNALLKPVLNSLSIPILHRYAQRKKDGEFWRRISGLLRFV